MNSVNINREPWRVQHKATDGSCQCLTVIQYRSFYILFRVLDQFAGDGGFEVSTGQSTSQWLCQKPEGHYRAWISICSVSRSQWTGVGSDVWYSGRPTIHWSYRPLADFLVADIPTPSFISYPFPKSSGHTALSSHASALWIEWLLWCYSFTSRMCIELMSNFRVRLEWRGRKIYWSPVLLPVRSNNCSVWLWEAAGLSDFALMLQSVSFELILHFDIY